MEMEGDQWENDILSPFVQQKSDRTTIILNKLKLISERYDARNPLANFLGTFASPELLWKCVQTKVTGVQFYVYRTNTKLVLTHSFYSGLFWPHLLLHWALVVGKKFEALLDLPVYYMLWVFLKMQKPIILKLQGFCRLVIQQCLGNVLGQ